MHDVAYHTGTPAATTGPRKQLRRYPKSALQKLLSMVEPIMTPLRNEHHEAEKDELHSSHAIDEILSSPGQRNSFQLFLNEHSTHNSTLAREFQFLCLCKEFREWGEKIQYGPYRIRVLAHYIHQNFIRENGSQALQLSDTLRKNIDRTMCSSKINPSVFEEAFQFISCSLLQQNVVRTFVESSYYQTMWDADEMDCHLKGLSLGGGPPAATIHSKSKYSGSLGSSTSSSTSSRSKVSNMNNVLGQSLSSELSSAAASEVQSVSSSRTGSSKSSTGSNASVAYDKYYVTKNSKLNTTKTRKKNPPPVDPAKLMEELLPRLEAISLEQTIRIQNYGALDSGPDGGDTPVVVLNTRDITCTAPTQLLTIEHIHHSNSRVLPHTTEAPFKGHIPHQQPHVTQPTDDLTRQRSRSNDSVEAMVCDDHDTMADRTKTSLPSQAWVNPAGNAGRVDQAPVSTQHTSTEPQIQLAYSFNDENIFYGKVLPGPHVTLAQFKDVVMWNNRVTNARYFFKRELPGIGEVHDEISADEAVLPFWAASMIFARIESFRDTR